MAASGDDGVVKVGVDVPQVPIALFNEIGLPRQNLELTSSPTGELVTKCADYRTEGA